MNRADFFRNDILARLTREPGFADIADKFTVGPLKVPETFQEFGKPMRAVHFPLAGMTSSVVEMANGESVEVICVGCQGMVNWETLLGETRSRYRHFGQIGGEMASIPCRFLMSYAAHPKIAEYITSYTAEVGRNAACNCLHPADQRLARWLLVAADKTESEHLALTQEFLAMMLGSRRATVTLAAGKLQEAGLITYRRGSLRILHRKNLIAAACECYQALNA